MRNTIIVASCGLAAAAFANCSPYSPDLGATPYLCATAEPQCPDDYTCVDDGAGRQVCVASGAMAPDAGSGSSGFQCADDGQLEPNNDIASAFMTDVGIGASSRAYGPLAVCPATDRDTFAVGITTANQSLEVITSWDSGSPVAVQILNSVGTPLANGTAMGMKALRACTPNLPVGQYFAQAASPTGIENNYRIEIKLVANCQL